MDELELLKRKLTRERAARKEAESILEEKAIELFRVNQELISIRDSQELEIKNRIAEIQDKERSYRNLIENASDLIYTCDIRGCITYVNPMLVSLSGYSEMQLIGADSNNFISEKYRKRVQNFYAFQLSEKLESTYTEFPVLDAKGNEVWIGQTVDLSMNDEIVFNVLARDISDRKKVESALMLSEEKYKSIIENMELGLLEVDRTGKIIRAYPKFSKLTGYSNDELVGKDAISYFLSDEEAERMKLRNKERLSGKSDVYEVKLLRKDGSEVWVLISAAPYYNEKGTVDGSIGIHLDISLQKDMEEDLRRVNRLAEDSLKAKDLFLANISHDIRTPLNAIIGISELMLDSFPTKTQKKYLETIRVSGDNLLALINEILDLSKIQSGEFVLRNEPVNLATLIEHVQRSFSVIGGKKDLPVYLDAELDTEQFYQTDAIRLKEVLFNLVGNAIKFTKTGSVTIRIEQHSITETHDEYLFEVIDTGVGIPEEELLNIFKIFTQASNTNLSSESGTGLGLAISKGIIEKMGGKLTVFSELGIGSSFKFCIDLERSDFKESNNKKATKVKKDLSFKGHRVLVVEDAEINRFLVNTILEKWGCIVSECINGQESVEFLKTNSVDFVLMDVRMPVMNGLEATQIIRNELGLMDLPIIALTANAAEGEIEKCKNAGMNDYLSKPYTQDELHEVISENILIQPQELSESLVNLEGIENITKGDEVFQKRMINLYQNETKLNIGLLHQAIDKKNEEEIVKVAHTMKGAAAHVCTDRIVSILRSIEMDVLPFDERIWLVDELITLLNQMLDELDVLFPN